MNKIPNKLNKKSNSSQSVGYVTHQMSSAKTSKSIKKLISTVLIMLVLCSQAQEVWVDKSNNYTLKLYDNAGFWFVTVNSQIQGQYLVQNNKLYLQDSIGKKYQYSVQSLTDNAMTLVDANGISYNYVKTASLANQPTSSQKYPWDNPNYLNVLVEEEGYQWRERENQLYLEFLVFLIGQNPTSDEVALIRADFINEFNQNPVVAMTDMKAMETSMQQVYSVQDMGQIAMMREVYSAAFAETVQQKPEMNNYAFVQVLNKYVMILALDEQTKLNLSNQDAQAYINYLQFQMMLSGKNYHISVQQRMQMQEKLSNEFNSYPLAQKQTLAFASFIWNNIQRQWLNMDTTAQQNYIVQMQTQLNIQNQNINNQMVNNFWRNNSFNNYSNPAQDFVDSTQRQYEADQRIYTMMENSMTEQHVNMMNIINADSDYEYVVDYNY